MQKRVFTVWNESSLDWLCVARRFFYYDRRDFYYSRNINLSLVNFNDKLIFTALLLDAQHQKDSVENKSASVGLLVVPLGKSL